MIIPNGAVVNGDEADAVITVSLVASLPSLVGSGAAGEEKPAAPAVDKAAAHPAHKEEFTGAGIAQRGIT